MREGVYVLRLAGGKYYVGSSMDIDKRIESHRSGAGAAFTRANAVEEEVEPATRVSDVESWERAETLHRMRTHGVDAVRGWMWTTVRLSATQRRSVREQLRERYSTCRACGEAGHFVAECASRAGAGAGPARRRTAR
jgi:predicted GIY-YIG superfamily endonuclease